MLFHDARSFFVLSPSPSLLSVSLFIRFISPAKSGSLIGTKFFFVVAWKLRGQRGLEHRYRVPDISWLEPPRRTLRRTMLVRGDPTLEDSYLRLVWWFSFVLAGIGQLPAVFYSPGHAYYAAFLLFPFSLLSFPLSLSLSLSLSLTLSLHLCLYRARGYEQEYKTGDIVLARRRFPSRVEFGLISRNSNLLLFFSFFFSTIRVSIFIVGRKFGDYSRVPGCGDSSVHVWIHRRRQSRITGDSLGRAKPTRFERWLLLSNNARCFYFSRFFLFIESQVERGTFVRVSFSFIPGSRWDGWCCCYNVADGGLAVVLW